MSRVPVHPVSGAPAARRDWLARVAEGCAILPSMSCPCCVGRVEMQVSLVRLLRERKPERVFVEVADEAHIRTFTRVLGEWPLAQYIEAGRAIRLPEESALDPATL
jgi:hypothetical protein